MSVLLETPMSRAMAAKAAGLPAPVEPPPAVDPPAPPVPPLALVFNGVGHAAIVPLPFSPGCVTPAHYDWDTTRRPGPGLSFAFGVNCEKKDVARPAIEAAMSQARERLARIRADFRDAPSCKRHRELAAKLAELNSRTEAVAKAPALALAAARKLLLAGEDPAPAEAEYVAATNAKALHDNRIAAITEAAALARRAAHDELRRRVGAEQKLIHTEAAEAARKAAAVIEAAVKKQAESLLVAQALAGATHERESVSDFWGGARAGEQCRDLP